MMSTQWDEGDQFSPRLPPKPAHRYPLIFIFLLTLTFVLAVQTRGRLVDSWEQRLEFQKAADEHDASRGEQFLTALVMPCTVAEAVWTLPLAMKSILDGQSLPHETIVVFGMTADLYEELERLFPRGLSDAIDSARMHLESFFDRWQVHNSTPKTITNTKRANHFASRRYRPADYLNALHLLEYSSAQMMFQKGANINDLRHRFHQVRYLTNLYEMFAELPPLEKMAMEIPNFKIILNQQAQPWANTNRQIGSERAFEDVDGIDDSVPPSNRIVSFLDCDDRAAPTRVHMIEQAFKENPDAQEVIHQYRQIDLRNHMSELSNTGKVDKDFYMILEPIPKEHDTMKWREELYDYFFDFRDPFIKARIYRAQNSPYFLQSRLDGTILDPRDLMRGSDPITGHWGWFVGAHGGTHLSTLPKLYPFHNGHISFRHQWTGDVIKDFPNALKGEDSRLTYITVQAGGKILQISAPLSDYVYPLGQDKRTALNDLLQWNRENELDHVLDNDEDRQVALDMVRTLLEQLDNILRNYKIHDF